MFELPARRSAVRARLRKAAMTCGPAAVRTVDLGCECREPCEVSYDKDFQVNQIDDPTTTAPHDVIVRVGAAGFCRTDIHMWLVCLLRHLRRDLATRRLAHRHRTRQRGRVWAFRRDLNRGGVRLGSAEIYGVVESMPEIADSLVVGIELPDGGYTMQLFVVPTTGIDVDDELRARIAGALRQRLSPRHIPDQILAVPGVPRTLTGKKLEVPVKRLLQGAPVDGAASAGAVDRPELLAWYADPANTSPRPREMKDMLGSLL
jgi:hypothetical protein